LRPESEGFSLLEHQQAGLVLPLLLGKQTSFCNDEGVGTLTEAL
jgi:hypothetical protein